MLLIIVTPDGDVQNRILFVPRDYLEQELVEASNFFNQHFSGLSFESVKLALSQELSSLQADISRLMQQAVDVGSHQPDSEEAVVIAGESKLLNVSEMVADMDRLRRLFSLFEKKLICCTCWMFLARPMAYRFISVGIRSFYLWMMYPLLPRRMG